MGASKEDVDRLFACFKCGISPPRKLPISQKMSISPQYLSIDLVDSIRLDLDGFRVSSQGETASEWQKAAARVCGSERRLREQLPFCFHFHTGSHGKGKRGDKFRLVVSLKKHEIESHVLRFIFLSSIRSHHQRRSNSETGSRCLQLCSMVLLKVFQ
jgi:hypothetical protein